ncbi:MAG TPA: hypothetical protein VLT90_13025 [Terriglobales bacterium]|nr:hypothetical protein [Terriglobales bacterium]
MTNLSPAQAKCLEALRAYGKPYAGGRLAGYRENLEGFKLGPADALVRKGLVSRVFDVNLETNLYSIA